MINLCEQCKHYRTGGKCDRAAYVDIDYITGLPLSGGRKEARKERGTNALLAPLLGRCGAQGRYFSELG